MVNNDYILRNKETKKDRFIRIVERRVNKILKDLDSLSKCSETKNYEYSPEDVKQIFNEIERKLREVKMIYQRSNQPKKPWKLASQRRLKLKD